MIRGARQLLTLRGPKGPRLGPALNDLGAIPDGSLLIRNGIIEEVGTTRRVENLAASRGATEINAAGRVVMPGFVDSHTHLVFPPPGIALRDPLNAAAALRAATGGRLQMRTRALLRAMARHGTTTVEAKTGSGIDESAELKLLRVMAGLKDDPLHVVPTFLLRLPADEMDDGAEAAEWVIEKFLPKLRRRRFARFVDVEWDFGRQDLFFRYLDAARRLGFPLKIHADQMGAPAAVALALEHSAVSVDHLEYATPADVLPLAHSNTIATLLPFASFQNGGRFAPARALIDSGTAVALATNFNAHHTPVLNMQTVIGLACMQMGMSAAEAISAATINGAHAAGRAQQAGSLEIGKSADLLILNVSDYRELAHQFGTNLVQVTIRRGECIYQEADVAPRPVEQLTPVLD